MYIIYIYIYVYNIYIYIYIYMIYIYINQATTRAKRNLFSVRNKLSQDENIFLNIYSEKK